MRKALVYITALLALAVVPSAVAEDVIVTNGSWRCRGPVDIGVLKVYAPPGGYGVSLEAGCTGRIGRIEIDTWIEDGIKIAPGKGEPSDIVVEGGYVKCHAQALGAHQDAVQAGGGDRIRFVGVSFDCYGNSNFFISSFNGGTPTDIVCDGCYFGPRSANTVYMGGSLRSGTMNSTICYGRTRVPFRTKSSTLEVVNVNNTFVRGCP
jgi:hypothetical protein